MENQSGQSVLSLCVTEEQRLAIQAFFNHNDWDFNEVSTSSTNQREENMCNDQENTENDQETVHNEESGSDPEMEPNDEDVCQECFVVRVSQQTDKIGWELDRELMQGIVLSENKNTNFSGV